ncbi:hypothetical protein F5Y14DRAFT_279951 [Nemania sp. NC0429]|nr:hypothetical protein F5Y14DRAFT_279951 [Nemania sp. NC0429]
MGRPDLVVLILGYSAVSIYAKDLRERGKSCINGLGISEKNTGINSIPAKSLSVIWQRLATASYIVAQPPARVRKCAMAGIFLRSQPSPHLNLTFA